MQSILITGGAGYVGSGLVGELLKNGYRVICVDNLLFGGASLISFWHSENFIFYNCDINNHDEINEILTNEKIDGVIHLAAIVGDPACKLNSDLAQETNWNASVNLVNQCIKLKIKRFIFASTCSNYGKMDDPEAFVNEQSPLAPVSLYAELKVKFENYLLNEIVKSPGFMPTALRFSTVYGLSSRMRFDLTVNEFTKELLMGRELVVFGEKFWRPYCHVKDFARAFLTVLKAPDSKVAYNVFNVGDTNENYTKEMIVDVLKNIIPKARISYVHKDEDPRDYRVDFSKIQNELGFSISKTVEDGVSEIKEILEKGVISNPDEQVFYNIPHEKA